MYTLSVQLANGDYMSITEHETLQEAVNFLTTMQSQWPQKYVVRDRDGKEVYISPETE